jgi:hypothetical protein
MLGDQYDFVHVEGFANLNGELQLALINGFEPTTMQSFPVLQSFGITGAFSNVANGQRLDTVDGMGSFLVHYGPGSAFSPSRIVLSAFERIFLDADFDEDGDVDGDDLADWRAGFGASGSATHAQGDADSDLDVDGNDFLVWQRQLGTSPGVAGATAIPEPGAPALSSLAVCGLAFRHRRQR